MRDRFLFERILRKLAVIDAKVSVIPQVQVQVQEGFLVTLNVLQRLGRPASASEVAAVTGRARANESLKLNGLCGRGLVIKRRQGLKVLFSLKEGSCDVEKP